MEQTPEQARKAWLDNQARLNKIMQAKRKEDQSYLIGMISIGAF